MPPKCETRASEIETRASRDYHPGPSRDDITLASHRLQSLSVEGLCTGLSPIRLLALAYSDRASRDHGRAAIDTWAVHSFLERTARANPALAENPDFAGWRQRAAAAWIAAFGDLT